MRGLVRSAVGRSRCSRCCHLIVDLRVASKREVEQFSVDSILDVDIVGQTLGGQEHNLSSNDVMIR